MDKLKIILLITLGCVIFNLRLHAQTTPIDTIYIPNVFSPNYDGINDVFKPITSNELMIGNYELYIYDRYGIKVFESNRLNYTWDGYTDSGIECKNGYYFCVLKCVIHEEKKEIKGNVFLIR